MIWGLFWGMKAYLACTGHSNVSRHHCEASECCFNALVPGIPRCYYPANAEISAYYASSLQATGMLLCM